MSALWQKGHRGRRPSKHFAYVRILVEWGHLIFRLIIVKIQLS